MSENLTVHEGDVGRAIFQSNQWRKVQKDDGEMPFEIFLDAKSRNKISVHLLGDDLKDVAQRCDDIAKQRGANRSFYGWAKVAVAIAEQHDRTVVASPTPDDRWHADIVLPCTPDDKVARERHAMHLAASAVCCPRPFTKLEVV